MTSPRTNAVRDEVLMQRFPEATWDRPLRARWVVEGGAITRFVCPFCLYRKGLLGHDPAPLMMDSWLVWRHLYEVHSVWAKGPVER